MPRWSWWVDRVLTLGGHIQLVLAILGAVGLSGATALAVGATVTPDTAWEYVFVSCVFAGTLPVSFPLSALALAWSLRLVEKARRTKALDDPLDRARKVLDGYLTEGRSLRDRIPMDRPNVTELEWYQKRIQHWIASVELEVNRHAGYYASRLFALNEAPDYWRTDLRVLESPQQWLRDSLDGYLGRLQEIRDKLPFDQKAWMRRSLSTDIQAGRALSAYLGSDKNPDSDGSAEVARWADAVWTGFRDESPQHIHVCAEESYAGLRDRAERKAYVDTTLAELERVWSEL